MPRKGHTKFSDKRVQVPKKLNQQMKRLHDEGKKMDKIIEILQLGNIPRSKFTEREKKIYSQEFFVKKNFRPSFQKSIVPTSTVLTFDCINF